MRKKGRRINLALLTVFILSIFSFSNAQWDKALHFNYIEHDFIIADTGGLMWPATLNEGTVEMWFRPDSILKYDTHSPDYTWLFSKTYLVISLEIWAFVGKEIRVRSKGLFKMVQILPLFSQIKKFGSHVGLMLHTLGILMIV